MRSSFRQLIRVLGAAVALTLLAGPALAAAPAGPDVSSHNHVSASIDWTRVAATGAPFAFVKATEGVTYKNPFFVGDWLGVAAAGMVRGTYHYARPALPLSTAADQANAFIAFTGTTNEPGDLPPALDMEEAGTLSPTDLIAWTQLFLDTVKQLTGRAAIIYTYPYFWTHAMANSSRFTQYPLWIADYNGLSAPRTPLIGGWPSWSFWQYTANGSIDGISGVVDASTFCCDSGTLAAMSFGGAPLAGSVPAPSPAPSTPTSPVPGAPTSVKATAANGSASVQWAAPTAPTDDPVTTYAVTPRRGGVTEAVQRFAAGATTQTVTGLKNGASYAFTVHAENTGGAGPESVPSPLVTPQAVLLTSGSDPVGSPATATRPLVVTVANPAGDSVTIAKTSRPVVPAGYAASSVGLLLTAPPTSDQVARTTVLVHASALPTGAHLDDLAVLRNGVLLQPCATAAAPCLDAPQFDGTTLTLVVRSVPTGRFAFVADRVGRVSGSDRVLTAIATSRATYPGGQAGAVVLARSDAFPDALSGTPLAAARRAPLLLTGQPALDSRTADEISRVLPKGGQVYLLGGVAALSADVAATLSANGFSVVRFAGPDRYSTAVAVANALGAPSTVLLATGTGFADGLSAGAAAAHEQAALLLTDGSTLPRATLAYLRAHPGSHFAVGGAAAAADPGATPLVGVDRYATAVRVARRFFPAPGSAGIASGRTFPDALSAGPALAAAAAPLLLAGPSTLAPVVAAYLHDIAGSAQVVHLHGGSGALTGDVETAIQQAVNG